MSEVVYRRQTSYLHIRQWHQLRGINLHVISSLLNFIFIIGSAILIVLDRLERMVKTRGCGEWEWRPITR